MEKKITVCGLHERVSRSSTMIVERLLQSTSYQLRRPDVSSVLIWQTPLTQLVYLISHESTRHTSDWQSCDIHALVGLLSRTRRQPVPMHTST